MKYTLINNGDSGELIRTTLNTALTDLDNKIEGDKLNQIEINGDEIALQTWNNKLILVNGDLSITIPSNLFEKDWNCRVIVLSGTLLLNKLGDRNWYYGNPPLFIKRESDFTIRQIGLTNDLIVGPFFVKQNDSLINAIIFG